MSVFAPKVKIENGKRLIFDDIRKKYVVATPEELVRQNFIHFLISEKKYPKSKISVEKGIHLNGLSKRFDIVVYDKTMKPWIIIECKAPKVPITQKTFDQAAQYNIKLQVNYLITTNGAETFCCKINAQEKKYEFLNEIPDYGNLKQEI